MWDDIRRALGSFNDGVLTWVDVDGYPVSVRTRPEPDDASRALRVTAPPGMEPKAGPASLLCHSHNEETWNLKAFLVRGRLEPDGDGWVLRPVAFVPGSGIGGPLDPVRTIVRARGAASRYLARRGLSRPAVPWDKIKSSY
jgi:hypothetical protein